MGYSMGHFIAMFYAIGIVLGYSMGMFQWVCFIGIAFNGYAFNGYRFEHNHRYKNGV